MNKIEEFNNEKDIQTHIKNLSNDWKSTPIKSKYVNYKGRRYKIFAEYQRDYSKFERFTRIFQALILIIRSFGKKWKSNEVKSFWYDTFEVKRFGVVVNNKNTDSATAKDLNLINKLPKVLHNEIMAFLDKDGLAKCHLVSKHWNQIASDEKLWNHCFITEKKNEWKKIGIIGEIPPLPGYLPKILKRECSFFPGKKIGETHMLALIPEKINRENYHLEYLDPWKRTLLPYRISRGWNGAENSKNYEKFGNETKKSHWVLLLKDIIPNSENIVSQCDLKQGDCKIAIDFIAKLAESSQLNYELPNALDVVTCCMMNLKQLKLNIKNWHVESNSQSLSRLCYFLDRESPLSNDIPKSGRFVQFLTRVMNWDVWLETPILDLNNHYFGQTGISPMIKLTD